MKTNIVCQNLGLCISNTDIILDAREILDFDSLNSQPLYTDGILLEAHRIMDREHQSASSVAERLNELGLRVRYDVSDHNTLLGINTAEDTNLVIYLSDGRCDCRLFTRTDISQLRQYMDADLTRLTASWRRIKDHNHRCNLENAM